MGFVQILYVRLNVCYSRYTASSYIGNTDMNDSDTSNEAADTAAPDTPGTVLNLSEAARRAGVARTTLYRNIKTGKVSATTMPDGTRGIDLSELLRAYGDGSKAKGGPPAKSPPQATTERLIQLDADLRVEQARTSMLEEQLAEGLKREEWQRQQIDRLLTHKADPQEAINIGPSGAVTATKTGKKPRGKLRRLVDVLLGEED